MTSGRPTSMVFSPMPKSVVQSLLVSAMPQIDELLVKLQSDRSHLPVVFPGIPRRFGKEPIGGGPTNIGPARVDLDAFRTCDMVAAHLVASINPTTAELLDLFAHGDIEERAMLLRSLNFIPLSDATKALMVEVLRTNIVLHLEAAMCDSNLFARATADGTLDADTANRLLLKFAFLDMDLSRAYDAEDHASEVLSVMLQDLATEREAAGRSVWRGTYRILGINPCPGALGRLIGGLEHGDDGVRRAAADGLLAWKNNQLNDAQDLIAMCATERLPREPRSAIRERLQQLASN
jgi:hypothetical protein